jgi:hypothetical protein
MTEVKKGPSKKKLWFSYVIEMGLGIYRSETVGQIQVVSSDFDHEAHKCLANRKRGGVGKTHPSRLQFCV